MGIHGHAVVGAIHLGRFLKPFRKPGPVHGSICGQAVQGFQQFIGHIFLNPGNMVDRNRGSGIRSHGCQQLGIVFL